MSTTIFRKGDDVPEWVQKVMPESAPVEFLIFKIDCNAEIINGETHVWPAIGQSTDKGFMHGKMIKENTHVILRGNPTWFHSEPREIIEARIIACFKKYTDG